MVYYMCFALSCCIHVCLLSVFFSASPSSIPDTSNLRLVFYHILFSLLVDLSSSPPLVIRHQPSSGKQSSLYGSTRNQFTHVRIHVYACC
ncbi:hypothetical protein F4775DRAFT_182435 [Biscogniauxia sp. FL1348]|nr:hypothetical protein F4775DRAFT_182435 [Biscogniauxia sp. FL1348]